MSSKPRRSKKQMPTRKHRRISTLQREALQPPSAPAPAPKQKPNKAHAKNHANQSNEMARFALLISAARADRTSTTKTTGRTPTSSSTDNGIPGERKGGPHRDIEMTSCIRARSQFIAFAAASLPRCGIKSPAKLIATISGHLYRELWCNWIAGTVQEIMITAWISPDDAANPDVPLDGVAVRTYSVAISRLTLGITGENRGDVELETKWIDWKRAVMKGDFSKIMLCDSSLGPKPQYFSLNDKSTMIGVSNVAVSADWVIFDGIGTSGVFQSEPVIGISRISPHMLLDGSAEITTVRIPSESIVVRIDFLLGQPVITLLQFPVSGIMVKYWFIVIDPEQTQQVGMLTSETRTSINMSSSERVDALLRMKRRDDVNVFFVGSSLQGHHGTVVVMEGSEDLYRDLSWLESNGRNLSQINETLFCVGVDTASATTRLCEIWDCNDTHQPLKVINLSIPPSPWVGNGKWKLVANSGFIFHFVGREVQVVEAASGETVITLCVPRDELNIGQPAMTVWSPTVFLPPPVEWDPDFPLGFDMW
ncbi:hypothetical protein Pelo_16672 [Pelomyxa schiedti]|nr:hypothetical protein Pelo_16672 [Pelomyxa schiedti]